MDEDDSHIFGATLSIGSNEARDRLHAIMTSDMAEAIEQIGQTLEACSTKKARLLSRIDEVARAVDVVRNECGCIDTTIASKVLHLNKLATQIVQQMALVNIPDPPPPPEPLPPPIVEIDLTAVHERLNGLDHMVGNLTKLLLEKEETVLYVVNKRPGNGEITTSVHAPIRTGGITHGREEQIHDSMAKLQTLVRGISNEDHNHSKGIHRQRVHHRTRQLPPVISLLHDEREGSYTNGQRHGDQTTNNDEDDHDHDAHETSPDSDQTTVGPCTLCLQAGTEDITTKRSSVHRSITNSNYTDQSRSLATTSDDDGGVIYRRRFGEALASNGTDIIYYDYKQGSVCIAGPQESSIQFHHGLVVDLYWWASNNEWLILSEQGLYRWKVGESDYRDTYEFTDGEIGFRRVGVTSTSIFCAYRYGHMLLELSNSMQMKRLHALAPPEPRYRKLGDISVRKSIQDDGSEEDILGLLWFGSGSGILLEERFVTSQANNIHQRLFRHVAVKEGRYARLAPYEDGQAWLISNTGADVFWIVHNMNMTAGRREAIATWVKVDSGIPINAVGAAGSTVCVRLQDGQLKFLASEH